MAKASGLNCKTEVEKLLWAVRTTANSDTGVSPFVLLRGRVPSSKLLRRWMGDKGFILPKEKIDDVCKKRVEAQNRCDQTQIEPRPKQPNVCVGDMVRVTCSRILPKGESKFSVLKKVVKINKGAVKLDDGRWWNKGKIAVSKTGLHIQPNNSARAEVNNDTNSTSHSLSSRTIKLPSKFHNYILQ